MSSPSMDFFQRQDDARRNTSLLIFLFSLAVIGLSTGTYIGLAVFMGARPTLFGVIDPILFLLSIIATCAFIFLGSAYKISSLSDGGSVVAESMGGVEVDPSSTDPLRRRLINVVEEMALASGVPVPRIYVLENEPGINAFAAGYTINDAAVAVTQGCLELLTRDELQGVIAHEFSHVLNGDMRLNIRLIGVIHGILLIYLTGRVLTRVGFVGGGRSSRSGGGAAGLALAGLAMVVFGSLGVMFGRWIKSAVSRQREYLADAAAVQFTRNPQGLAGALKKIGGYSHGSAIQAANAEEVSHMCFGNVKSGGASFLGGMLATHPPLEERIRRIDPSFAGQFAAIDDSSMRKGIRRKASSPQVAGLAGGAGQGVAMAAAAGGSSGGGNDWSGAQRDLSYKVDADNVINQIGEATPEGLVYCASLMDEIPRPLMEARSNLLGAITIVYTLLLDEDIEERRKQGGILQKYGEPGVVENARKMWPAMQNLEPELRLPLLDLVFPTLRRMTSDQFQVFAANVDRLIMADGRVILKEFIIEKVLIHRLELALQKPAKKIVQFHSFSAVVNDLSFLLTCLAYVGHDNIHEATNSFHAGKERVPQRHRERVTFLNEDQWSFPQVDVALDRLSLCAPAIKRTVVDACAHCVMGDGVVTVEEAELLRAICDVLDAPLPPFIPEATRRVAA